MSVLAKKAWKDITRKKTRSILTILTIGLAVTGLSLFGAPEQMKIQMQEQVLDNRLHDVRISLSDANLTAQDFGALEALDNVKHANGKIVYVTKMYEGEARNDAVLFGVDDFDEQHVNVVTVTDGDSPQGLQVLSEQQNAPTESYDGGIGDDIELLDAGGGRIVMEISGEGSSMIHSGPTGGGFAVFYAPIEAVRSLGNLTGYNSLEFDLEDTSESAVEDTIAAIRDYLVTNTGVVAFAELPEIRDPDSYPGEDAFTNIMTTFMIITVVAVASSVFLIVNTMNTIITEQVSEIGSMKAIGATKYRVAQTYLTMAALLGLLGALVGIVIGFVVDNLLIQSFGGILGVQTRWMFHFPTYALSMLAGVALSVLAAGPALIKSTRITVRQALQDTGVSAGFGHNIIDQALMKSTWLPRNTQMGLRNVGRKKGRSASTIMQIGMAVGAMLSLIAIGNSLVVGLNIEFDRIGWDVQIVGSPGAKALNTSLVADLEAVEGVEGVEPFYSTEMQWGDQYLNPLGMLHDSIAINHEFSEGRTFTAEEYNSSARVVVMTVSLQDRQSFDLGDRLTFTTATGEEEFEVIGVDFSQLNNGDMVFMPLSTVQDILQVGNNVTGFYLEVDGNPDTDSGQQTIDEIRTAAEDVLLEDGYPVFSASLYQLQAQNQAENGAIVVIAQVLGLIIVAISMLGLVNALMMNVIDRTREIGVMRSIGSSGQDIRRVFGSESLFLSFFGWVVGIPIGYVVLRWILVLIKDLFDVDFPLVYPLINIALALVGTLILCMIVIIFPLRRAANFKPGDALRYQ